MGQVQKLSRSKCSLILSGQRQNHIDKESKPNISTQPGGGKQINIYTQPGGICSAGPMSPLQNLRSYSTAGKVAQPTEIPSSLASTSAMGHIFDYGSCNRMSSQVCSLGGPCRDENV